MLKSRILPLVVLVSLLGLAAGMLAQGQQGPRALRLTHEEVVRAMKDAMALADVDVQQLAVPSEPLSSFSTLVVLDGEEKTLELQQHSMRHPEFQFLVQDASGDLVEKPAPEPRTYRGKVEGEEESRVAAFLTQEGELRATILLGGERLYCIEPVSRVLPNIDPSLHAVFRYDEILVHPEFRCGVENPDPVPEGEEGEGETPPGPVPFVTNLKLTEIALDSDVEFYQLNGSNETSTLLDMENVMNGVETIFENDVLITYEITTAIVRTAEPDPYSTSDPTSLLNVFANYWNANYTQVRRDVAHLFTGKNLTGGIIGIARLASICTISEAYSLVQSRYSPVYADRVGLSAHEIGHNWSAIHCDGDADCKIMCSSAGGCTGIETEFGSRSITYISSFRNSRPCLYTLPDPVTPPFYDAFESAPVDVARWVWNKGGAIVSGAFNEPSEPYSLNLDSTNSSEFGDDEIRTNAINLAGLPNITMSFYTQHRGPGVGESLMVEYQAQNGLWYPFETFVSDGAYQSYFQFYAKKLLSPMVHSESRFRFRVDGNQSSDEWYVDNVSIATSEILVTVLPDTTSAPPTGDIYFDAYLTNLNPSVVNPGTAWVDVCRPDGSPLGLSNPKYGPKNFTLQPAQQKSKLNIKLHIPADAPPGTGYRVIGIVGNPTTGFVQNASEFQFEVQ